MSMVIRRGGARARFPAPCAACFPQIRFLALALVLTVAGCGLGPERDGAPRRAIEPDSVPDAVPRAEPKSRYGNPPSYVVNGQRYYTRKTSSGYVERGIASWYGTKFHGRRTSNGDTYDMYAMTAAHRSLPLPTYVQVTNLQNGRRAVVRVNDRGPFHANRIIDLSYAAATKLGIVKDGTGLVEVRALDPYAPAPGRGRIVKTSSSPSGLGLYLQLGAFVSRANAERLKSRVDGVVDGAVRISEALSGGRPIYRVRVGPLAGVERADRLAQMLAQIGLDDLRVVLE